MICNVTMNATQFSAEPSAAPSTEPRVPLDPLPVDAAVALPDRMSEERRFPTHLDLPPLRGNDSFLHRVDEAALRALLEDVAPQVVEDTGFLLDVGKVNVALLDPDEVVEWAMRDLEERFGTPDLAEDSWEQVERTIERSAISLIVAMYLPTTNTVVYNRQVLKSSPLDTLRLVTRHELTHAAQQQNFPNFACALIDVAKRAREARKTFGKDSPEHLDARDTINARMSWIEGHPTYFDTTRKDRYPDAVFAQGPDQLTQKLLMNLTARGKDKAAQYSRALRAFALLADDHALVRSLYERPEFVDLLLKTTGRVEVNLAEPLTPEGGQENLDFFGLLRKVAGTKGNLAIVFRQPDGTVLLESELGATASPTPTVAEST